MATLSELIQRHTQGNSLQDRCYSQGLRGVGAIAAEMTPGNVRELLALRRAKELDNDSSLARQIDLAIKTCKPWWRLW